MKHAFVQADALASPSIPQGERMLAVFARMNLPPVRAEVSKPSLRPWQAALIVLLLTGCAITKVDPPPPVTPAAQFKEAGLWQRATSATPVPDAWWQLFNDPVLNDLQARLVIGNENLKASVAQVASARAALEASRSALFPTLSANLSATRGNSSSSTVTSVRNSVTLSADASWELDLWGRLSQATTGAQASLQASVDDLAAARLSAQATLAQTYFSLRSAEAQQALLERSVEAYQRSLELTQIRYRSGVAAQSDVLQAQTQLKSAQASLVETNASRAQLEHAIAVLLGQPPSALSLDRSAALPAPPAVPVLLPATLLERRPDIAAAQRRVAAAYAQIGVADAAFFPSLTLSASAGYRNSSLSNLVSAPNLFWSLGPSIAQAIFDGGQRKLASAQARASADQATATYRQAVLTAMQEVEDNLVLADQLQQEAALQQEALDAAQRNLQITLEQYRAGTVSYLNVVTAQTAAFTTERSLLDVRNRQLAAVNQLLKNIAGRWERA
jgi:NodT family efflux transporter outer membrane factor (OMF) lipoprotein